MSSHDCSDLWYFLWNFLIHSAFSLALTHSLALAPSLPLPLCSFHIIYFNQKIFAFRGKVLFSTSSQIHSFFRKKIRRQKNFPLNCRRNYFQSWWYVWGEHKWGPIMKMLEMSCTLMKIYFFLCEIGSFSFLFSSQLCECARVEISSYFQAWLCV